MEQLNGIDQFIVDNNDWMKSLRIYSIGLGILTAAFAIILVIMIIRKRKSGVLKSKSKKTKFGEFYANRVEVRPVSSSPIPRLTRTNPSESREQVAVAAQPVTAIPMPPAEPSFSEVPEQPLPTVAVQSASVVEQPVPSPVDVIPVGPVSADPRILEVYFRYDDEYQI